MNGLAEPRIIGAWRSWPQKLAQNVIGQMPRRINPSANGYQFRLLYAARTLSAKFDPPLPLDQIVVFYPRCLAPMVGDNIRKMRLREGGLGEFKGLLISSTPRLRGTCMAFRLEDVENHRTPADAYYIITGNDKQVKPAPLYTKEESMLGKEIHE